MGTLHTYELEVDSNDYPELLARPATIIVKYWYYPAEREWFDPRKGEGAPAFPASVEIHTAFIERRNGEPVPLRAYPELYEAVINEDLEDRIAEAHADSPGDF